MSDVDIIDAFPEGVPVRMDGDDKEKWSIAALLRRPRLPKKEKYALARPQP